MYNHTLHASHQFEKVTQNVDMGVVIGSEGGCIILGIHFTDAKMSFLFCTVL